MKVLCLILELCFIINYGCAQSINSLQRVTEYKGTKWTEGLTWEQVKQKAKEEDKFIFLDCYATWCGPCKKMDQEVYMNDTVGNYMNDKFISIKVQMDTSTNDNEDTKSWYKDAHTISDQYNISSFPTYLFFSSQGKIVHRDLGFKTTDDFVKLSNDAIDTSRQYYTLLEKYNCGVRDFSQTRNLIQKARQIGEDEVANKLSQDYIDNFMLAGKTKNIYTKENAFLICDFLIHQPYCYKEKSFDLFIHHIQLLDSGVAMIGWTSSEIDYIILKQEAKSAIEAALNARTAPDWRTLKNTIRSRYGSEFVERNVLRAQIRWYSDRRDVKMIIKYLDRDIKKYPTQNPDLLYYLNHNAWNLFLSTNNKRFLKKALTWSELSRKMILPGENPSIMDTKANILYKLGRTIEAIALEGKAVLLNPTDRNLQATVEKMKKGERTWVQDNSH